MNDEQVFWNFIGFCYKALIGICLIIVLNRAADSLDRIAGGIEKFNQTTEKYYKE